jgi:hypothetical protein
VKIVSLLDELGCPIEDIEVPNRTLVVIFHGGQAFVRFGLGTGNYRRVPYWSSPLTPLANVVVETSED